MKRFSVQRFLSAGLAMVVVVSMAACAPAVPTTTVSAMDDMPADNNVISVNTYTAESSDFVKESEFVGKIEAKSLINVYTDIAGEVVTANFNVGEYVEAGDVLFSIDTEALEKSLQSATLSYNNALNSNQSGTMGAENSLDMSEDAYESARDAYNDIDGQVDDAYYDMRDAQRAYEDAQDALTAAMQLTPEEQAEIAKLQAAVTAAQAEYDAAKYEVDDAKSDNPSDSSIKTLKDEVTATKTEYDLKKQAYEEALATAGDESDPTVVAAKTAMETASANYTAADKAFDNAIAPLEIALYNATNTLDIAEGNLQAAMSQSNDPTVSALQGQVAAAKAQYDALNNVYNQLSDNYDDTLDALEDQKDKAYENLEDARISYELNVGSDAKDGTLENSLEMAQISYNNALENLAKATVTAPVSGTITVKNVSVSGMASQQAPAYVIKQEGTQLVAFSLAAHTAETLDIGDEVVVVYNGEDYAATIVEMATQSTQGTGLFAMKAETVDPLPTSFSGTTVKVRVPTYNLQNTVIIPLDSVYYDENQAFVYIYENGFAVRKDIVTDVSTNEDVVVLEGVQVGDRLITTWHPELEDGSEVVLRTGA